MHQERLPESPWCIPNVSSVFCLACCAPILSLSKAAAPGTGVPAGRTLKHTSKVQLRQVAGRLSTPWVGPSDIHTICIHIFLTHTLWFLRSFSIRDASQSYTVLRVQDQSIRPCSPRMLAPRGSSLCYFRSRHKKSRIIGFSLLQTQQISKLTPSKSKHDSRNEAFLQNNNGVCCILVQPEKHTTFSK